ncbi:MAG: serine hydrolase domain-containing protein [Myxococcota bacterium]
MHTDLRSHVARAVLLAPLLAVTPACSDSESGGGTGFGSTTSDTGAEVEGSDGDGSSGVVTDGPALDDSSGAADDSGTSGGVAEPIDPDFGAVDELLEQFVANHLSFPGASIVIVDGDAGVIHRAAFGDYTVDSTVMLASVSKVPSAMLLMALDDDPGLDFEIDAPAETYLPWDSAWPGITTEHMLSNTSGMPGLQYVANVLGYGPHLCQFLAVGQLLGCAETIYRTPLPLLPHNPPGTAFDYGGSQWQLAGAVAEIVGGRDWADLFDDYIADPCELEVFEYGNMWTNPLGWNGGPDSLIGQDNPSIEGGAISNIDDYAKILMMHLNEGRCGDTAVMSPESVEFMRIDRGTPAGSVDRGYGLGWWIMRPDEGEPYLYIDPGAFGAVSWIDTSRNIGGLVAFADYALINAGDAHAMIVDELIPLVEDAYDAAAGAPAGEPSLGLLRPSGSFPSMAPVIEALRHLPPDGTAQ